MDQARSGPLPKAGDPSLPQISYSAINDQLRDKHRYPSTLRTVPSATHHIEAMVQLMLHFRWNWIVVLMSNDDYGRDNSQLLRDRLARSNDVCIAFQEVLPTAEPQQAATAAELKQLEGILLKMKQATARVVVVFSPELALHNFFREALRWNVTDIVWIASESWAIDPVLHNLTGLQSTGTFLGITIQEVPMPGFSEFRLRRPEASPARPPHGNSSRGTCNQECEACLNVTKSFDSILTLSGERVAYCVYSAVYAVAHALHNLLRCSPHRCRKKKVYPWQVSARAQARTRCCHGDRRACPGSSLGCPLKWGAFLVKWT